MSLQEEIAGMRVRTWKNLVGDDLAEEIITKVSDACIQAITDNPHKSPIEAITDMRRKV